jgi:5-methylcytosine-specific restriction endonuclease McrA
LFNLKPCLRDPIPEIFDAARGLDAAVSAHLQGDRAVAAELIRRADLRILRDWTNALWGKGGPWSRPLFVDVSLPSLPKANRLVGRMPSSAEKRALIARDGHHCPFCGIPLIRAEIRSLIRGAYPDALAWGATNDTQHAGFQTLWLQYDHLVPHARGGTNAPDNMLITCAPCNFGRGDLTIAEAGLSDPRLREPVRSTWDGLERFS